MAKEFDRRAFLRGCALGACGLGSVIAFGDLLDVHAVSKWSNGPVGKSDYSGGQDTLFRVPDL